MISAQAAKSNLALTNDIKGAQNPKYRVHANKFLYPSG